MIKAVIFDCFGVLTTDGWLPFKRRHFQHDPAMFEKATALNGLSNAHSITYEEFISQIAQMAGLLPTDTLRQIETSARNDELLDYIKTLKPRYKIGMLSNTSTNLLQRLFSAEQIDLFDRISLSNETGVIKPDERAYEIIAKELDVLPDECVFIDDQQKHIEGAKAFGMRTILYQDFDQMKTELEKLLASGSDN